MWRLFKKKEEKPFVSAIIAAGGSSSRMEGQNKLLCEIGGLPVLIHTMLAFETCGMIDEIVLVARDDVIIEYSQLCQEFSITKLDKVVTGGAQRAESVLRGLGEVSPDCRFACVHDAARPLILPQDIERVCRSAFAYNAAAAVTPVTDTIKLVSRDRIEKTVDRASLMRAQTPQCADVQMLRAAIQGALEAGETITDECSALERMGVRPAAVVCPPSNIKITTPEDLFAAEAILEERE